MLTHDTERRPLQYMANECEKVLRMEGGGGQINPCVIQAKVEYLDSMIETMVPEMLPTISQPIYLTGM